MHLKSEPTKQIPFSTKKGRGKKKKKEKVGWKDFSVVKNIFIAENLGLIPSTHIADHNHLSLQFQGIQHPLLAP